MTDKPPEVELYAAVARAVAIARGIGAASIMEGLQGQLRDIEWLWPGTYGHWLKLPNPPSPSPEG
jgi:hypothetical protein